MLEFIEEALDEVSFAVEREIAGPWHFYDLLLAESPR